MEYWEECTKKKEKNEMKWLGNGIDLAGIGVELERSRYYR